MTADDTREEAVYRALLMYGQGLPRAGAAEQFIRWLEQDGFTIAAVRRDPEPVASADAAWEALAQTIWSNVLGIEAIRAGIARHRPAIEAAIRGTEAGREPLAEAVITALDVYGTMGNGEGWTLDADVIGTLWIALTPEEKARTGYDVAAMNEHHASADSEPSLLDEAEREPS